MDHRLRWRSGRPGWTGREPDRGELTCVFLLIRWLTVSQVVLVRMCADGAKPAAERFGYSNALTGLYRVAREEGIGAFGRGLTANVTRSVLMSRLTSPHVTRTS